MGTFAEDVNSLTGLNLSTELNPFIQSGVNDVIHKVIAVKPEEIMKFCSEVSSSTNVSKTGPIVSVVREHDSGTILRPCSRIAPEMRYEATDTESLHYRSKYNPGYYELDGKIYTVPAAGGSNNAMKVTLIVPDEGILHNEEIDDIANFPNEYGYLVTLYTAIKAVEMQISNFALEEEDLEMVQSAQVLHETLNQKYATAFMLLAGPQQKGPGRPRKGER